jgi:hypothetical protein
MEFRITKGTGMISPSRMAKRLPDLLANKLQDFTQWSKVLARTDIDESETSKQYRF